MARQGLLVTRQTLWDQLDALLGHLEPTVEALHAYVLSADVIHGDLSDFNVLLAADGPVLIDFPQAVHAASNPNARKLLIRDVENLHRFAKRYAPDQATRPYAQEMWSRYEAGRLEPDSELQGDWRAPESKADIGEVIALIEDADRDEEARREARGEA